MKVSKKVMIIGLITAVILTIGISTVTIILANKNTENNESTDDTASEIINTETGILDENTTEVIEETVTNDKLFNEEDWEGEDVDKAKAYNYYNEIKNKLSSPEDYLIKITEIANNKEDTIKSFPKKTDGKISEIYKDTTNQSVVLVMGFNKDNMANRFELYNDNSGIPDTLLLATDTGYINSLLDTTETLRVIRREYEKDKLIKETEIIKLENGIITCIREDFSEDSKTCKQTLELKLTTQTEFNNSEEQFKAILTEVEQEFFKNYTKEENKTNEISEDTNTENK